MEEYTAELKKDNYLSNIRKFHTRIRRRRKGKKPKYVGTERCTDCHKAAGEVWEKTPHSHAYKTLVDAKQPSNRQYDPECIVCHTVGFGYNERLHDGGGNVEAEERGLRKLSRPRQPARQQSEQRGVAIVDESVEGAGRRDGGRKRSGGYAGSTTPAKSATTRRTT